MQKKADSLFHQGRVLAVTGQADDFKEALRRAYEAVAKISFDPPGASGIVAALFVGWLFWREALKDLVRLECCHSVLRRGSANRGRCMFCEDFWFLSFLICFLRTFGEKLSGCLSTWHCCMFGSLPTCWWIEDNGSTPCWWIEKTLHRT